MNKIKKKPLSWEPTPETGFKVIRRDDGGMDVTFTDASRSTLEKWRDFAYEHLIGSDSLTRNLYDLRLLDRLSQDAVQIAIELNSDPTARNIRLAVVVSNQEVTTAVQEIIDGTTGDGARMSIFDNLGDAEEWLNRPIESMI